MRTLSLFLCLLLTTPAGAQSLTLPATVNVPLVGNLAQIVVRPTAMDADDVAWFSVDPGLYLTPSDLVAKKEVAIAYAGAAGTYRLRAVAAKVVGGKAVLSPVYEVQVVVGTPTPGPGPTPGPTPGPAPSPAPIPVDGFRCLIVYESGDLTKMPPAQQNILFGKSVRDYLNSKCPVGADGKTKEWRIYDKDVDTSAESKVWQDAMKVKRDSVPWLILSNGKTGYSGPLPATVDDFLSLAKKYAE